MSYHIHEWKFKHQFSVSKSVTGKQSMRNLGIDQILLTRTHRTIPLQHWVNLGKPGEDTLKLAHIPVKFEWSLLTCHFNKLIPMVTTQNSFPEVSPAVKSILLSLNKVLLLYHFLNINNHLCSSTKISNSFSMCCFISNFFFLFYPAQIPSPMTSVNVCALILHSISFSTHLFSCSGFVEQTANTPR